MFMDTIEVYYTTQNDASMCLAPSAFPPPLIQVNFALCPVKCDTLSSVMVRGEDALPFQLQLNSKMTTRMNL